MIPSVSHLFWWETQVWHFMKPLWGDSLWYIYALNMNMGNYKSIWGLGVYYILPLQIVYTYVVISVFLLSGLQLTLLGVRRHFLHEGDEVEQKFCVVAWQLQVIAIFPKKKKKEDWLNLPDAWHPQANHAASQQWRHARGVVLGYSDGELNAKFRHDSSVTMKRIQCNTLPHRQANIQNKHSWTRCGVMTTKCDSTQGYLGAMNICPSDSKLFGSSDSKSATERGKIIQEGG